MMSDLITSHALVKSLTDFFYYASLVMIGIIAAVFIIAEIDERLDENREVFWFSVIIAGVVGILAFFHYYQ